MKVNGGMKILITGAYGFVGTNLCRYLTERGYQCDALDVPAAKRDDVPYRDFYTWSDLGSSPSPLPFASYDAVVHLAGKAHDLKKVASEREYFDVNVGLTKRIFDALRQQVKVRGEGEQRRIAFIYFSSSKASADGNAYGRSKLAAEEYLTSAVHLHLEPSPLRVVILRPAMIHGPGNKGNLNLLWGIARRGLPWPLAAFENRRSFTSIGNVCAAVEALCGGQVKVGGEGERSNLSTFPIADDEMLSTNRLIELIGETCGRKAKLWRIPKPLMRLAARIGDALHLPLNTERIEKLTEDSFVDNSKLKAALGWKEMPIRAEDGMRKTLESFKVEKLKG